MTTFSIDRFLFFFFLFLGGKKRRWKSLGKINPDSFHDRKHHAYRDNKKSFDDLRRLCGEIILAFPPGFSIRFNGAKADAARNATMNNTFRSAAWRTSLQLNWNGNRSLLRIRRGCEKFCSRMPIRSLDYSDYLSFCTIFLTNFPYNFSNIKFHREEFL